MPINHGDTALDRIIATLTDGSDIPREKIEAARLDLGDLIDLRVRKSLNTVTSYMEHHSEPEDKIEGARNAIRFNQHVIDDGNQHRNAERGRLSSELGVKLGRDSTLAWVIPDVADLTRKQEAQLRGEASATDYTAADVAGHGHDLWPELSTPIAK